jgi:hypothetical protein
MTDQSHRPNNRAKVRSSTMLGSASLEPGLVCTQMRAKRDVEDVARSVRGNRGLRNRDRED